MILVDIGPGMDEHDFRLESAVDVDQVFQDFLAEVRKAAGFKRAESHVFLRHAQDGHAFVVLIGQVLEQGVFLVVRQRDAKNFGLVDDVGDQRSGAQFDVVGMRAEEANPAAVEGHGFFHAATWWP